MCVQPLYLVKRLLNQREYPIDLLMSVCGRVFWSENPEVCPQTFETLRRITVDQYPHSAEKKEIACLFPSLLKRGAVR